MADITSPTSGPRSGDREKRLILIADSEGAHLYYTSMLLQRLEYNIHTTTTAKDLIEVLDVAQPALVLTEMTLPDMDGAELLKTLKRNPRTYAIPIIVLTKSKDPAIRETCMREGCAGFFQKPVEPDALYAAIQKATESRPRQYIRINTSMNVIVGDEKEAAHFGTGDYVTALSEHGMYISTTKPRAMGLQIPITLLLEDAKIKVEGMVLYSFQRGEGPMKTPGMGIKFVRIAPEDQNLIRVFIKKEITKGLSMTMGQMGGTIF
jgi:CheY-like chemotaxis protein